MKNDGNGLPGWAKAIGWLVGTIGVPAFLLLYMSGALSGVLPYPAAAHDRALRRHDRHSIRILMQICQGVWRGDPERQVKCLETLTDPKGRDEHE